MKLYLTSPYALEDKDPFPPCIRSVCRAYGYAKPHVCLSAAPLLGAGEWVYEVEVADETLLSYEYRYPFRQETERFFAVPFKEVDGLGRVRHAVSDLLGAPWDRWAIPLQGKENQEWSLLWASGAEGVEAHVSSGSAGPRAVVSLTPSFNVNRDYLLQERHWKETSEYGKTVERWEIRILAGVMPKWALFPWAWAQWVFDPRVQESAIAHILRRAPSVAPAIEFARSQTSLSNLGRAWRIVGESVSNEIGRDIGMLGAHSKTATTAIPMRIAQRIGGWTPPRPKPEHEENPHASGRVLVANPSGAFPTQGLGVDVSSVFTERPRGKRNFTYPRRVDVQEEAPRAR